MDTELRVTDPSFERQRTEIPKALMEPLAIVEALDERKDVSTRLVPCVRGLVMNQFILQRTEEALRHGIVITVALATQARFKTKGSGVFLEAIKRDELWDLK